MDFFFQLLQHLDKPTQLIEFYFNVLNGILLFCSIHSIDMLPLTFCDRFYTVLIELANIASQCLSN